VGGTFERAKPFLRSLRLCSALGQLADLYWSSFVCVQAELDDLIERSHGALRDLWAEEGDRRASDTPAPLHASASDEVDKLAGELARRGLS
jgi:hypothetical protein